MSTPFYYTVPEDDPTVHRVVDGFGYTLSDGIVINHHFISIVCFIDGWFTDTLGARPMLGRVHLRVRSEAQRTHPLPSGSGARRQCCSGGDVTALIHLLLILIYIYIYVW